MKSRKFNKEKYAGQKAMKKKASVSLTLPNSVDAVGASHQRRL